jgi:hypothetical protein
MPQPTHCIDFAAGVTGEVLSQYLQDAKPGVQHVGQRLDELATFWAVYQESRGAGESEVPGGRGTSVGRYLHDQYRWPTLYVSSQVADLQVDKVLRRGYVPHQLTGKGVHIPGADTRIPVDVTLPVEGMMLPKEAVRGHKSQEIPVVAMDLAKLREIPFAFGVAYSDVPSKGWGTHTFILAKGQVLEAHYEVGPTSADMLTSHSLRKFMQDWPTFILVTHLLQGEPEAIVSVLDTHRRVRR